MAHQQSETRTYITNMYTYTGGQDAEPVTGLEIGPSGFAVLQSMACLPKLEDGREKEMLTNLLQGPLIKRPLINAEFYHHRIRRPFPPVQYKELQKMLLWQDKKNPRNDNVDSIVVTRFGRVKLRFRNPRTPIGSAHKIRGVEFDYPFEPNVYHA